MNSNPLKTYYSSSSPQKNNFLRTSRVNSKSSSFSKGDTSLISKSIDFSATQTQKNFSPQKERPNISPIPETRSIRSSSKSPIDSKTPFKASAGLKTWTDLKGSLVLTKNESERFSPYISAAKKEGEFRKSKLVPPTRSNITIKPAKPVVIEASTTTTAAKTYAPPKEPHYFSFVLGKGNNDALVRRVLKKRFWWKETTTPNATYDFCWYQTNKPINFTQLNSTKNIKRMANHFEFNREIGTKNNLLRNLQTYCDKHNLELFKLTPVTFILDLYDSHFTSDLQAFTKVYNDFAKTKLEPVEDNKASTENSKASTEDNKVSTENNSKTPASKNNNKSKQITPRTYNKGIQSKLPDTYYTGTNLWLLKPTDFNRGRGINLFNKLATLDHYLKCFQKGEDPSSPVKPGSSSSSKTQSSSMNLVKSNKFVVQKYIEKPMLIEGRKFDARVWALVDQEMNLYWFKEGYLRLSSEEFSLDDATIEDKYVHLTNNAVQKYGKNYGKHESGNIISLNDLEKYLPKDDPKVTLNGIKNKIKEMIKMSMDSVKSKLNSSDRKHCFEIFGYDFIMDAEFNVWIIEVNSNPCIEESNALLQMLVPRMLDDAFRLTIDKVFVPKTQNFKAEEMENEDADKEYPVTGYGDSENIWQYISSLRRGN